MEIPPLIDDYASGPQKLRDAIAGMMPKQFDAAPVPGKWSTRQVVCHLADFEPVNVLGHQLRPRRRTRTGAGKRLPNS